MHPEMQHPFSSQHMASRDEASFLLTTHFIMQHPSSSQHISSSRGSHPEDMAASSTTAPPPASGAEGFSASRAAAWCCRQLCRTLETLPGRQVRADSDSDSDRDPSRLL
jgi:hypothetical protein